VSCQQVHDLKDRQHTCTGKQVMCTNMFRTSTVLVNSWPSKSSTLRI